MGPTHMKIRIWFYANLGTTTAFLKCGSMARAASEKVIKIVLHIYLAFQVYSKPLSSQLLPYS